MKKLVYIAISISLIIVIEICVLLIIVVDGKWSDKEISQQIIEVKMDREKVYIPIDPILQLPELPNGCEITSVTALLRFNNYEITKTEMADSYLRKQPFYKVNNKLYGANPYEAYAGNPRDRDGFFAYAPPIVEAANRYLAEMGGKEKAKDISGSSREEILERLDQGIPMVIWVTHDLSEPRNDYSWYIHGTEKLFQAPVNLHTVVLNGYEDHNVHVIDPLKGQLTYPMDAFFESYMALGSYAMMIDGH